MSEPRPILRRALILCAAALILAACGTRYPLGMSEAEWKRLTPQQQLQARTKQADISKARSDRRAQLREEKRRRHAMLVAAENRRIKAIYASARYGDILECVMDQGQADFHPGWHKFSPVPFSLVRGEGKYVKLRGGRRTGKFWVEYSRDGLEVSICYRKPNSRRSSRDCGTVAGLTSDYANGIVHTVTASNIFQSARVLCTFRPGREVRPEMRGVVIHQENITIRNIIYGRHHRGRSYPRPYRNYSSPGHRPPPRGVRERSRRDDRDSHSRRRGRGHREQPARSDRRRTSTEIREAARREKAERAEEVRRGRKDEKNRLRRKDEKNRQHRR